MAGLVLVGMVVGISAVAGILMYRSAKGEIGCACGCKGSGDHEACEHEHAGHKHDRD
ncbi:MAG: hypothetical protein GXY33_06775 [Phycisphaerae bacterium]|nr:hypothetical protein [Phycisphaerae bacterium]